ncbi:Bestrophin, RFP-TM, chloride channel-domain-containing protein [Amylostereum chailletii]|nr:Bestrophin, RFP-TM, chloride channel-domain-containing protein [Amylostereum chailletii]
MFSISPILLTNTAGMVIGFVISYRASSGYDRYWQGRTSWGDVIRNTRTFARLVWFHTPLRLTPKTPEETSNPHNRGLDEMKAVMKEKRTAVELVEAYVVALKHHLRGEPGLYYEDLYHLTHPLHKVRTHASASISFLSISMLRSSALTPSLAASVRDPVIPPINSYGSTNYSTHTQSSLSSRSSSRYSDREEYRPLLPSSTPATSSLFSKASADLIPFASMFRSLLSNGGDEDGGVQRRWIGETPQHSQGSKYRPRVAGSGENMPIEILRYLSDWMSMLEDRGTVPGTSLGSMIGCLSSFEDNLSALERILTTPLPFVYSVHISTVWIYLFFLPFQLVDLFGWYTIPGVAIASFIYLGFLAAGEEIEQPFGRPLMQNDLDLDLFCREIVHADMERLKQTPGYNVFLGSTQTHSLRSHDETGPLVR